MTVEQLIEELKKYPKDALVYYFDDSCMDREVEKVELAKEHFPDNPGVLII